MGGSLQRVRDPGAGAAKARPFALGYSFAGLRLGVQALGLGRIEDIRRIFELDAAAAGAPAQRERARKSGSPPDRLSRF